MKDIKQLNKLEQTLVSIVCLAVFMSFLIGISFTSDYVNAADNITNLSIIAIVNVTNTEPNITSITIDDNVLSPSDEIDLTAGNFTVVICNATIFDYNGYEDITNANKTNATLFIQGSGADSQDDNNSHYSNSSCGRCRQATAAEVSDTANTAICDCQFSVQYYANDSSNWVCDFHVSDDGGHAKPALKINLTDNSTGGPVTITKLLALDVPAILDYGNLSVTQTSAEIIHNVTNVGNIDINLSLRGFGGIDETTGNNLSMVCDIGNISIGAQRYSVESGIAYDSMFNLTNQTRIAAEFGLNITFPQRIDDTNYGSDRNSTYWRIKVPLSVGGLCNGTIIFGAVDAEV
jgi:hypothetical protein